EDNQVDTVIVQEGEFVRQSLAQQDVTQVLTRRQVCPELCQHLRRKVQPQVALARRRQARQQQPGTASDLQHPVWLQGSKVRNRLLNPQTHLCGRDRFACVAAVPAHDVE